MLMVLLLFISILVFDTSDIFYFTIMVSSVDAYTRNDFAWDFKRAEPSTTISF